MPSFGSLTDFIYLINQKEIYFALELYETLNTLETINTIFVSYGKKQ